MAGKAWACLGWGHGSLNGEQEAAHVALDAVLYGSERKILVLGIGNILWADEGFGVRAVEYLAARYSFGPDVEVMDGGTQGLYLLPVLEDLETLIIVDAIDFGLPPATLHHVEGSAVPATIGARKMSLHQTGFQEVLRRVVS
ncbi:HyaD/HybD family hydrogenase maturation endopeptidase [Acetobacter lambici]|uniref:HyaD/HybD family hydrogenase maturation endopeptidase n=1 Tax=Acetobacter lambici TaxID=1332824 RepID=UPI0018E9D0D8|nr:HyaD/HybD family hydrogenase maturation endopeptidase [Acetobacter lambici]MCP1244035.1 HyaD/HybD family hydrogenase maturation endopeptidase [Acetobacter lambici]